MAETREGSYLKIPAGLVMGSLLNRNGRVHEGV